MRAPVGECLRETSTMVCSTEIVRRKKSMCLGRSAMSSPQRRPVSMSVITRSWNRSGIAARSWSYSSGVRMRVLRGGILGSSMPSHGLVTMTRSRTARLNTEWSITWYLVTDVGESPDAAAAVTQSWTCLLYTSDAADDLLCVDLGGRRIIKKKKKKNKHTTQKT